MMRCFENIRDKLKDTTFESPVDSAFFSKKILSVVDYNHVEFTALVPFERLTELKGIIEQRKRWRVLTMNGSTLKPTGNRNHGIRPTDSSSHGAKHENSTKCPIQLHLFEPRYFNFDYKVIVTNKSESTQAVVLFHTTMGMAPRKASSATPKEIMASRSFLLGGLLVTIYIRLAP